MNFLLRQKVFISKCFLNVAGLTLRRQQTLSFKQSSTKISNIAAILNCKDLHNEIPTTNTSIELLPQVKKRMELNEIISALNQIFKLQKESKIHSSKVIDNKNFELLCKNLTTKGLEMDIVKAVECLKIFNYLGVKSDSKIVGFCLSIIQQEVNELTLDQMVFLNFLLKKMTKTPLIEALQIAIPMVFQIQLGTKLDHENVKQLVDLLQYAADVKLNAQSTNSIVTALTVNGCDNITPMQAVSIMWSLCDLHQFNRFYVRLLQNSLDVIKANITEIDFNPLETTLTKVVEKIATGYGYFYDEIFFKKVAEYAIVRHEGFNNSIYILKKFNRIGFVSYELLDYIDSLVLENPILLKTAKIPVLLNFLSAYSMANYKSKNWEIIKSLVLENSLIHSCIIETSFMKFALEMLSLNFYDQYFLQKIFAEENLEKVEKSVHDRILVNDIHQAANCLTNYSGVSPNEKFLREIVDCQQNLMKSSKSSSFFKKVLAEIFESEEAVLTCVPIDENQNFYNDFVIAFDSNQNAAVTVAPKSVNQLRNEGLTPVAVFFLPRNKFILNYPEKLRGTSDLKFRILEKQGIPYVYFSIQLLKGMDEFERIDYIRTKILIKLRDL